MGQQQLLLLVLTIVIVSIAVFIGIDFFGEMLRQRHVDLLVNHAVHVASEAVTWRAKGTSSLGGGDSYSDLGTDGMAKLLMAPDRVPGTFEITKAIGDDLEVGGLRCRSVRAGIPSRRKRSRTS